MNTNRKILIAAALAFTLSVITSQLILLAVYQPWLDYNPERSTPYIVESKIKTVLWDSSIVWIDIPLEEFYTEIDEEPRIHRHYYRFVKPHMGLEQFISPDNASTEFAVVSLIFLISAESYNNFGNRHAVWRIEATEQTISNFKQSEQTGEHYMAEVEITGLVNKLPDAEGNSQMPQRVEVTIVLFNR